MKTTLLFSQSELSDFFKCIITPIIVNLPNILNNTRLWYDFTNKVTAAKVIKRNQIPDKLLWNKNARSVAHFNQANVKEEIKELFNDKFQNGTAKNSAD